MMARRTGIFHKQSTSSTGYNRFLPLPASKRCAQGEVTTDAAPRCKKEVQADRSKAANVREEPQHPKDLMETPRSHPSATVIRSHAELKHDAGEEEYDENEPLPDLEKDDMMARRTGTFQKSSSVVNRFLPVPGSVKYNVSPVSGMKPLHNRPKVIEKMASDRSVSMSDMVNEDELGRLPTLSQSRYERMQEQYSNFQEEEDHWQNDLARWKTRRRSASQELIKKEEERKRMEKRMKEEGSDSYKRKTIKTYKEILEEKERRELELCEAYRNAATPEEAAMVLQRYALRFTISDATLDSLKLPRSTHPRSDTSEPDEERQPDRDSETSAPQREKEVKVESIDQKHTKPEEAAVDSTAQKDTLRSQEAPKSPLTSAAHSESPPPRPQEPLKSQNQPAKAPSSQEQSTPVEAPPQTKHVTKPQPLTPKPTHTLTSASPPTTSSRPVPLLAAKPYTQPKNAQAVKSDGLVRVNGESVEDSPSPAPPASPLHPPQETKDVPAKQVQDEAPPKPAAPGPATSEQSRPAPTPPPPQAEKSSSSISSSTSSTSSTSSSTSTSASSSTISSLLGGRNCITTTTIVTELTQTFVEPHTPDTQSSAQVNGTAGLFEKPAEEKQVQPTARSNGMQEYSPTVSEGLEESSVSEQYEKEQEKLKNEWEKAQLEVQEEERKHNEEERKILEETVTPLNPTGLIAQPSGQTTSPAPVNSNAQLQHNGQRTPTGREDQHASKLHFLQDSPVDGEASKKEEVWKTSSLDRNPQLNQANVVKRSGSHDAVTGKQKSPSSSPQPPSPSRCVSGKRLCSGCSQPLGKGAAMIIDTLGLFFHIQCFKCGVCAGQLGDATTGTDVRIRNGLLSCHDCYIASRGRGQPTTL